MRMLMKLLMIFCLCFLFEETEAGKEFDAKFMHLMRGENFFELLHGSMDPWFISFYLPNCGYCKAMALVWVDLSVDQYNKTNVGAVSCESDDPICIVWEVNHVPTMYLVKDGAAYLYDSDKGREIHNMVKFIEEGYKEVEPIDIPHKDDFLEELRKEQWKNLFANENIPSPATLFAILVAIALSFLICLGYCCAPSVNEEDILETKAKDEVAKQIVSTENVPNKDQDTKEESKKIRKRNKKGNKE